MCFDCQNSLNKKSEGLIYSQRTLIEKQNNIQQRTTITESQAPGLREVHTQYGGIKLV